MKWGRKDEFQRYRCRGCQQTFNSLTMTPQPRLKIRRAWDGYAEALVDGLSVRKAGKKLKIHFTTAFRWRGCSSIQEWPALLLSRYTQPEPELKLLLDKLKLDLPAQPPPRITASELSPPAPL